MRAAGAIACALACHCAAPVADESPEEAPLPVSSPAGTPAPAAVAPVAAESRPVRLGFVGDVNLALSTGRLLRARSVGHPVPDDVAAGFPFAGVRDRLLEADLLVGNLECAVAEGGEGVPGRLPFRAPLEALDALDSVGFDVLSVANNHTSDLGVAGFDETIRRVSGGGFAVIGGRGGFGPEPQAAVVRTVRGIRIGLLGYPAVQPEKAVADVKAARAEADLLVVFNHWGMEGCAEPTGDQIRLAHQLVDAGADIVVGTHAHLLQPEERRGRALVFYGLGDFVFAGNPGLPHHPGGYLELDVDRTGVIARRFYRVRHDRHGAPSWLDREPVEPPVRSSS